MAIEPSLRAETENHLALWGLRLDADCWGLLDSYGGDVLEYNRKVNITAAKNIAQIVRRHFIDALAALKSLRGLLGPTPRLCDVGAGAGFIGLTLKIAWPEAHVTLIESAYRKYCFLNWSASRLGLAGLRVLHARVEKGGRNAPLSGFDAVLSRALAPLDQAVELTLPLAAPGGICAVYQSQAPDARDAGLDKRLPALHGHIDSVLPYRLPLEEKDRHLVFIRRTT